MKKIILSISMIILAFSFFSCEHEPILCKELTVDFRGILAEGRTTVTFSHGVHQYTFDSNNGAVQTKQIPDTDLTFNICVNLTSNGENAGCRYFFRSEFTDVTLPAGQSGTTCAEGPQKLASMYTFEIFCR